jgi:F-type H+-transporting ATPase subunit a
MMWSTGLGLVFVADLRPCVARKATAGVPGGLQNFVEMIIEFIDDNVRSIFTYESDDRTRWR